MIVSSTPPKAVDGSLTASGGCLHDDVRCACGSLLARRVADAVELKCRRCKRTWVIPFEAGEGTDTGVEPQPAKAP